MSNIDGIQKLSKEEIEARRKIILGMIGEDVEVPKQTSFRIDSVKKPPVKPAASASTPSFAFNDAVLTKKTQEAPVVSDFEIKMKETARMDREKLELAERQRREKEKQVQIERENKEKEEKIRLENERRAAEERARKLLLEKQEQNKKEREEREIREKVTRMEQEQKKRIEDEKRAQNEKAESEKREKKRRVAEAARQAELKKIREERRRVVELRKKQVWEFLESLKSHIRKGLALTFVSTFVFLAVYFVFVFSVLSFKLNVGAVRFIGRFLIVPAIVVDGRVVDYKTFMDMQENQTDKRGVVRRIVHSIIERDLLQKYKVNSVADLEGIAVWDYEINKVPVSRIRNIKKRIDAGGDFIEVAKKYGEELKKTDINTADMGLLEYGDKLKSLNLGEKTDIITLKDGYYIFMCSEKYNDKISVSYVYVKAKTAQEYIDQAVEATSYLSFVE